MLLMLWLYQTDLLTVSCNCREFLSYFSSRCFVKIHFFEDLSLMSLFLLSFFSVELPASTKCRTQDAGRRTQDAGWWKKYLEYDKNIIRAHYCWDLCNGNILHKYYVHIFVKTALIQANTYQFLLSVCISLFLSFLKQSLDMKIICNQGSSSREKETSVVLSWSYRDDCFLLKSKIYM